MCLFLNINALANAVKPVVIPGETMNVMVVKSRNRASTRGRLLR